MKHICFDRCVKRASPLGVFAAWGLSDGWLKQNEIITYSHSSRATMEHILEWDEVFREVEGFTNLKFVQGKDWDSSILRIDYVSSSGSWSFVGNDNYGISKKSPTTNIGWLGRPTKRHEVGHFIGLGHEHQTPNGAPKWNKPYIYEVMGGPPNNWTRDQTDWNFFRVYDQNQTVGTVRDPESIMMYPIPAEFTLDGFSTSYNETWSVLDIKFLSEIYPKEVVKTESIEYMIIKSFIKTYMGNDCGQLRKLKSSYLKEIAKEVGVSYTNRRTTANDILEKLKN